MKRRKEAGFGDPTNGPGARRSGLRNKDKGIAWGSGRAKRRQCKDALRSWDGKILDEDVVIAGGVCGKRGSSRRRRMRS